MENKGLYAVSYEVCAPQAKRICSRKNLRKKRNRANPDPRQVRKLLTEASRFNEKLCPMTPLEPASHAIQ